MNCFFFYIDHMYINKSYTDFVKKNKKIKKYKHLCLLNKLFFSMNVLFHFWASARMWLAKWSSYPAISCNGAATRLPLRTVFFFFNFLWPFVAVVLFLSSNCCSSLSTIHFFFLQSLSLPGSS